MITIKVRNQLVTWPDDFAVLMMRYYKRHDVPFVIHRNNATASTAMKGDEIMVNAIPAPVKSRDIYPTP